MAETARPVLASIESDDFISWDPWGDDDVRWPGGYWNDIVQPLLEPREDTEDGDASGDDAVDQSDHIVQIMLEPGEGIEDGGASGEIDFDEFSGSGWDHLSPLWEQMTQDPSLTPECALRTDEQPQTEPNSTTQEVRDEEREPTKLEKACAVCLEDVSRDRFPDLTHAENNSQHTSDVCLDCWDDHLEAEVKSKGFEGVSCPQCSHKLLESEVRKLAKANTYVECVPVRRLSSRDSSLIQNRLGISTRVQKVACSRTKSSGPVPAPLVHGVRVASSR